MSLKILAIVGGLVTVGAVGIPVAYTSLKDKTNRSYTGRKSEIWFENGECKYRSTSYDIRVGRFDGKMLENDNLCLELLKHDLDWKSLDIKWDNVAEGYKERKAAWDKWMQSNQVSQTENSSSHR